MAVEVIYIVRHGYRMNFTVNPSTGKYKTVTPTPTGIPSDPELASYGVDQARQLAEHIVTLQPEVEVIYSSPFYRCLQTLKPTVDRLIGDENILKSVRVDNGIGEFYGAAHFIHPGPAPLATLQEHFDFLSPSHKPTIVPIKNGETLEELHNRNAYALHRIISDVDAEPGNPKSILICTHAASMICMGRALTGQMPDDPNEEDFRCGTCALSKFVRRKPPGSLDSGVEVEEWNEEEPDRIPFIDWKNGNGIKGGWDCVWNGDCSFLEWGEERTWTFSMTEGEQTTSTQNTENDEVAGSPSSLSAECHLPSPIPPNSSSHLRRDMSIAPQTESPLDDGEAAAANGDKSMRATAEEMLPDHTDMQNQAPAA